MASHSFGHLLTPTFLAMSMVLRWPATYRMPWPERLMQTGLMGIAQIVMALGIAWWLTGSAGGQAGDAMYHLEERWETLSPLTTPTVYVREWLLPYLPWSLLSLFAILFARSWHWGWAVFAGLALHLPLSVLLLGYWDINEVGAYQVALAPAAVLAARAMLPARFVFAIAILLAAAVSVQTAKHNWPEPASAEFVAGVQELHSERQFFLIVGKRHELDGARAQIKGLNIVEINRALGFSLPDAQQGKPLEQWWDEQAQLLAMQGMPLLLSDSARRFLAESQIADVRRLWYEHVLRRYQLVPERRAGFVGTWVLQQ